MSDDPEDTCPDCGGSKEDHEISLEIMRADWAQEFLTILLDKADTQFMSEGEEQSLIRRSIRLANGLMNELAGGMTGGDGEDGTTDPELN